jgi:hypothetical protein
MPKLKLSKEKIYKLFLTSIFLIQKWPFLSMFAITHLPPQKKYLPLGHVVLIVFPPSKSQSRHPAGTMINVFAILKME